MVVSPGSAHSFGILVIGNNVVVIGKVFMTDGADPALLGQSSDLAVSASLPVTVVPDIRAGDARSSTRCTPSLISLGLGQSVPCHSRRMTCESDRIHCDGASWQFLLMELVKMAGWRGTQGRKDVNVKAGCYNFSPKRNQWRTWLKWSSS